MSIFNFPLVTNLTFVKNVLKKDGIHVNLFGAAKYVSVGNCHGSFLFPLFDLVVGNIVWKYNIATW